MKKLRNFLFIALLFGSVVFLAGCGTKNETTTNTTNSSNQQQPAEVSGKVSGVEDQKTAQNPGTISYNGEDNKTAFELLQKNAQVDAQSSSNGVFVQSINGVKNSEKEFWIFYINGQMASVASDKYVTKSGDKIEWRYQGF